MISRKISFAITFFTFFIGTGFSPQIALPTFQGVQKKKSDDGKNPVIFITGSDGSNTVSNGSITNDANISLTFTANENISGFAIGDLGAIGGNLSSFSGTNSVYSATFTPSSQRNTVVYIPKNVYTDESSNNNIHSIPFYWTYDATAPVYVSGTSINSDNSKVRIFLSERVYDTDSGNGALEIGDFTLSISGGSATLGSTNPTAITKDTPTFPLTETVESNLNWSYGLEISDLDLDGDKDIIATGLRADKILWYENDGSGEGTLFGTAQNIDANLNGALGLAINDLDGDGDMDVIATAYNGGALQWYKNNGSEDFGTKIVIDSGIAQCYDVRLSDLDGDGDMDIVATGRSSDKIVWYVNDGLENFTSTVIDNSVNGPGNFVIKDLDEDGDLDLIVAVIDGGNVVWYANNGSQNFGDAININTNFAMCRDLDVVDMDEDGDLDIVALSSDAAGNEVAWFSNDGSENFTTIGIENSITSANYLQVVDLDGDSDEDIVITSAQDDDVIWYQNDGSENFTKIMIDNNLNGAAEVKVDDVDGDGDLDVVATSIYAYDIKYYTNIDSGYVLDISLSGLPNGNETLTISPTSNSIYDIAGNAAATSQSYSTVTLNSFSSMALDLDGTNDYVAAGEAALGGSITVECWIKPENIDVNWSGFVCKNNKKADGEGVFWLGQHSTAGVVRFGIYLTGSNATETALDTDGAVLSNDSWYHVAATYDGNYQKIYINGSLVKTSADRNTVLPSGTSEYRIGLSTASYFNGIIDEVRIWNTARTADEIADNMERELVGNESDLVAYYKMSNGSGTTLTDNSSNSNTGTLTNMVTSGGSSDWVTSNAPLGVMNTNYITDLEAVWEQTGTNDSPSSDGLYMTMGTGLTEENWAVYGNNNTTGTSTSDLPSGVGVRSGRIWQIDEEGTVAPNVTIDVDESTVLSTFAHGATANKFLYRSGSSGDFTIGHQGSSTGRANKTVSFSSVGLDSGYYYTIGLATSLLSDGTHGSTSWSKGSDFDGIQDRAYQSSSSSSESPLHRSSNGDGNAWTVSTLLNFNDSNGRTIWQSGAYEDFDVSLAVTNSAGLFFNYGEEGSNRLTFTNSDIEPCTWYSITVAYDGGTTGYINYALDFDGSNDYVSLPNSINMGTSDFTLSIRLNTDGLGSRQHVLQQTGTNSNRVIAINSDGSLTSRLGGTGSDHDSGVDLSAGTWYHIVLVHDNSANTIKWYVNGTAQNTNSSVNIPSNNSSFYLGINANANDKEFDGKIDELRIWNAALSEAQIPGDSGTDSILVGNESNLVAYYRFDHTSGTSLNDRTSNNNDGTLNNMNNSDWVTSGVSLAPLDSLDDYYGRFNFYTTDLSTGAVSALTMARSHTNYGHTGAVSGQFYVAARGGNSYVLASQFSYVGVTNSALSSSAIQGNASYVTGFALDPVGWANANFSIPSSSDANNNKIWLFGDGSSDTESVIYNYIAPSDNDSRLIREGDTYEIDLYIAN